MWIHSGSAAVLMLQDGRSFAGVMPDGGPEEWGAGEVVFNTSHSGYEEIVTDPSYHGQIVVMTQPEMGNYGISGDDGQTLSACLGEPSRPTLSGLVVRRLNRASHHRAQQELADYLRSARVPLLTDVDTRALTLHLRDHGAMPGLMALCEPGDLKRHADLVARAQALPNMTGQFTLPAVSCQKIHALGPSDAARHVVVVDCGVKAGIVQALLARGVRLSVVPYDTPLTTIEALQPDAVVISNGPGDPECATATIETARGLMGRYPLLGICLGHQILALALGARTYKLPFGHRGANHPVLELSTRRLFFTSQNHGFAVSADSLPPGVRVTHVNVSDGSLEGFDVQSERLLAVQYHPEASPGPTESAVIFDALLALL